MFGHFNGTESPCETNLKKTFFCKILLQICYFFAFFQLFAKKYAENDYFNQHLGCGAPKCWSKYTTLIIVYVTMSKYIEKLGMEILMKNGEMQGLNVSANVNTTFLRIWVGNGVLSW